MNASVLFRSGVGDEDELRVARAIMGDRFLKYRTMIEPNSVVIGRYSVLPFYKELEDELATRGSRLVNSYTQHKFLADINQWYPLLQDLTPKTYTNWIDLPDDKSYVLKGTTNSRKHQWGSMMFARYTSEIPKIASKLLDDSLIGQQGIVVREYVPLENFGESFNGLPISNEWRHFVLNGEIIGSGFYWADNLDLMPRNLNVAESFPLVNQVIQRINIPFFVVDTAKTVEGDWIVIELNDAQMSGLSDVNGVSLYNSIKDAVFE
jgi:hypothetical protein